MPYPDRLEDVERLVAQHRELKHQSLLLAIYYERLSDPDGVYLFEVISQFGYDEINYDQDMFEIEYASTSGFPLPQGSHLHLMLTSLVECRAAVEGNWPALSPLRDAIRNGRYRAVYQGREGVEMLSLFRGERVPA